MATKSIHNNKKSNTKKTAKKLEQLIEKVKSKPVFVVGVVDEYYTVVNYITKETVVKYLPTKRLAEAIRDRYNNKKVFPLTRKKDIADCLTECYKLRNDIIFYEHAIQNADDADRRFIITTRRREAVAKQRKLTKDLHHLIQ